jgi:hypothetical protein
MKRHATPPVNTTISKNRRMPRRDRGTEGPRQIHRRPESSLRVLESAKQRARVPSSEAPSGARAAGGRGERDRGAAWGRERSCEAYRVRPCVRSGHEAHLQGARQAEAICPDRRKCSEKKGRLDRCFGDAAMGHALPGHAATGYPGPGYPGPGHAATGHAVIKTADVQPATVTYAKTEYATKWGPARVHGVDRAYRHWRATTLACNDIGWGVDTVRAAAVSSGRLPGVFLGREGGTPETNGTVESMRRGDTLLEGGFFACHCPVQTSPVSVSLCGDSGKRRSKIESMRQKIPGHFPGVCHALAASSHVQGARSLQAVGCR